MLDWPTVCRLSLTGHRASGGRVAPAFHHTWLHAAGGHAMDQSRRLLPAWLTLCCFGSVHVLQWLQQCHAQGTAPTCPMCQAHMQLAVKWHVWKALFAPEVWQLPARRRGRLDDEGLDGVEQQPAAQVLLQPHNNYLLRHNPRLAELLVDMQQLLAPENVQLLADVQVGRQQQQCHLSLCCHCLHWSVRLADNPTIACTQAFVVFVSPDACCAASFHCVCYISAAGASVAAAAAGERTAAEAAAV